jgi:hypothetical protein
VKLKRTLKSVQTPTKGSWGHKMMNSSFVVEFAMLTGKQIFESVFQENLDR